MGLKENGTETGYWKQKAYENRVQQEKTEYLNVKEARDKKSALEKELESLKNQAKGESKKEGTAAIVASGMRGRSGTVVSSETQNRISELEKEISDLNKNINLASRAQNKKYLYNSALNAEDFDEYSFEPEKEEQTIKPHQQNINRETETVKRYMTEDEKAVYNYYLNKFGEEKAEEYFDSIREELNQRQAGEIFEGNEGKTVNEYIQGAAAGLENAKKGYQSFLNMILGTEEPQPTGTMDFVSQMAREDLADRGLKLPEALGGASLGQIGFDVVNTTANMLPSLALGTLGGGAVGAVAIGASAAGNAYNSAITEGYSKEQATNYAALVGASETALGYILGGIEATGGKMSKAVLNKVLPKIDNALAKAAVNVGGKMLSEFSEEYLQEVLTPVFENIALLENNEIDLLSEEAIYSGILGALSAGGILGAPTTVKSLLSKNVEDFVEYENFKKIIGDDFTYDLDSFKKMKYNEPEKWEYSNKLKNYLVKYPDSNKKYFDAFLLLKKEKIKEGVLLPPKQKQAFIMPEGKHDPYHIFYRMQERNITDDDLKILMKESKAMFSQWNGQRQLFVGEKGACVIVKQGDVWIYKTAWLKNDNDEEFDKILEVLKNVGL